MARLIITVAARTDLTGIIDYLEARAGTAVARRYAVEFDAALDRISEFPALGSPRPELGPGTRLVVISPYLVLYEHRSADETAVVLRVLDGRRNITGALLRP
jgi:plasmid stabilization system protein ParE